MLKFLMVLCTIQINVFHAETRILRTNLVIAIYANTDKHSYARKVGNWSQDTESLTNMMLMDNWYVNLAETYRQLSETVYSNFRSSVWVVSQQQYQVPSMMCQVPEKSQIYREYREVWYWHIAKCDMSFRHHANQNRIYNSHNPGYPRGCLVDLEYANQSG